MAKKYTSYNKLSNRGELFVDLSNPENISQLTKRQRYYMKQYQDMYRADLESEDMDYYLGLPEEIQADIRYRQKRIFSGQAMRDAQKTYFDNYATGLRASGANDIADLLERISKTKHGALQRQALIDSMPDLKLYYGRTSEANSRISPNMVSDAIGDAASSIIDYALEKNINIIGKDFTIANVSELYDNDYLTDEQIQGIRSQYLKSKDMDMKDLAVLNDILGLPSDDIQDY